MLHRLSYGFLTKTAVYGAVLSVSGSFVFYYLIQRNLTSGPYYTEAVEALRQDKCACGLLGEPLRFQSLKLGDPQNRVTTEHAHLLIPVSGTKAAGQLRSQATFRLGRWHLDYVILEFKGRPQTLDIVSNRSAYQECTASSQSQY